MNTKEHLLACLGEEGSEIAQDVSKCLRFGLEDRNVLNPSGPTNRERLIAEMNDFLGVAKLLVEFGIIPANWQSEEQQIAKKWKVRTFMTYAVTVGALRFEDRSCRRCGCTESNACFKSHKNQMVTCSWAEIDLCTFCLKPAERRRLKTGDKNPSQGKS